MQRLIAARIGVPLAVIALMGGLAGKARAGSVSREIDATASRLITGSQIKNGSLTLKDLKKGQVYSQQQVAQKFVKQSTLGIKLDALDVPNMTEIGEKYLKLDDLGIKLDALDVPNMTEIGEKYLKLGATATNADKLGGASLSEVRQGLVQGNGSVLTNARSISTLGPGVVLLRADGLADVKALLADQGAPRLRLANTGDKPLDYVITTSDGAQNATVQPGAETGDLFFGGSAGVVTIQLIGADQVATFTVSARPGGEGEEQFIGQGLVGG